MVTINQQSIIDIHKKRKRNPNITLKTVIKSQEKRIKEERRKKTYNNNPKTSNKMAIRTYISITLNVHGLNSTIKTQSN